MRSRTVIAVTNAAAHASWALSQIALLILLSHMGLQRLVGVVSIGLGVFALTTLFLGMNLRVAVATDHERSVGFRTAIAARSLACLGAYPVALASMAPLASGRDLLAVALLVAVRIPDQISDVIIGFYVRESERVRISASFLSRGVSAGGVVAAAWILDWSLLATAIWLIAVAATTTLTVDVLPGWFRWKERANPRALAALFRSIWRISPYPGLDALHFNSLRFVLVLLTSSSFYGLVAIAQVLFGPFQIILQTAGYSFIEAGNKLRREGRAHLIGAHVGRALYLGAACAAAFALACLLLPPPAVTLLFADKASEAAVPLLITAMALSLQPISSFLSMCVIGATGGKSYVAAPVAAIVFVWVGALALLAAGQMTNGLDFHTMGLLVGGLFLLSYALRAAISLRALRLHMRSPPAS